MVDLITEKIGAVNSFVIPQRTENKTPKFQDDKNNSFEEKAKKIFPFGMITGGALLVYYGVKKPSGSAFLKKLAKDRISKISQSVQEFSTDVKQSINEEFKGLNKSVQEYKKNRWIKPTEILSDLIQFSKVLINVIDLGQLILILIW